MKAKKAKYADSTPAEQRSAYRPKYVNDQATQNDRALTIKDRSKTFKYIVQLVIVAVLILVAVRALFFMPRYQPYAEQAGDLVASEENRETPAFVSISYFGVERFAGDSRTLISKERLSEHLKALKMNGYETVSQQDVINYYSYSGTMPKKALFLMFEDGRRDTAAFAQPLLTELNYLATANTYAEKFEKKDGKFLSAKDLKTMLRSTFWELGTNGYRLSYINVFDRYQNYYGHLNSNEFLSISKYLKRDYNHYLMDFERDKDRIREESVDEMKQRIQTDYELMQEEYVDNVGYLPESYTLMHSNTGAFGTDALVSDENRSYIASIFSMNFNREGSCMNSLESSVYDLTRMQPQANWYSNHLLMRIKDDMGQDVIFVTGDETEAGNWSVENGAAEYRDNVIVLTSEGYSYGRMALKKQQISDVYLTVTLDGNVSGNQGIYLRADRSMKNGIYVGLEYNVIKVREYRDGESSELFSLDLYEFEGGPEKSVDEDELEGLIALQDAILQYDENYARMQNAQYIKEQLELVDPPTIEEGSDAYVPAIDLIDRASRQVAILLKGKSLSIQVDGKSVVADLGVSITRRGTVALECAPLIQEEYSQRNLADDVYDGVFTDLTLQDPDNVNEIFYSYRLNGVERIAAFIKDAFEALASFFAEHF